MWFLLVELNYVSPSVFPIRCKSKAHRNRPPTKKNSGNRGNLLRNNQIRSGAQMIRIGHLVLIGLKNFHVLVGVAVELFADFRKIVAGLHVIGARGGGARSGSGGGLRGGR